MENLELVSVIVPIFNGEKYIRQFLNSIYKQTYRPLKVILADDNSTDKSVKIIKEWKKKYEDNNFEVCIQINQKNVGLSKNISLASKKVEGEYICLADQDDIWEKDKVQQQVNYLRKNLDCFFCLCDRKVFMEKIGTVIQSEAQYYGHKFIKYDYKQVVIRRSQFAANCLMFRNNYLNKIFPIPKNVIEHDTFIVVIGTRFGKIGFLNQTLLQYRIHENNLSSSFACESSKNILECFKKNYNAIKREQKISTIDSQIIKKVLYKRIKYEDKNKNFRNDRKRNFVGIQALERTIRNLINGKIGMFYK